MLYIFWVSIWLACVSFVKSNSFLVLELIDNPAFFMRKGEENPIENEDYYIKKIAERFTDELAKYYETGTTKRMFHPKMHGLVEATFEVEDNIPSHLKKGLFASAKSYPMWARFSNAKRHPTKDIKKDIRGLALKLIGVEGEKLIEEHQDDVTQDFILVTTDTLQTATVKDFQKSIYALTGGFFKLFFYGITHLKVIIRSLKQIDKCSHLLETPFFSSSAYLLGDGQAVKYAVFPQSSQKTPLPAQPSDNFLRERLVNTLGENEVCLDFMIQEQLDPESEPVEDPTVSWKTPFIKVATIRIKKQSFDSAAQMTYGENLSFNPWHSLTTHRPLGGANRARKFVYKVVSDFRRKRNDVKDTKEPTTIIKF